MGYSGKRPNNWNPWILSNILTVFLLNEQNERRRQRALTKALTELQYYYDGLPADGGCDEGTAYWGHAGASLFECLYLLKLATHGALDLFGDKKLALIASYMQKAHICADVFVNVADAHPTSKASMMPLLFGFAKETEQEGLMDFAVAVYRIGLARDPALTLASGARTRIVLRRFIFDTELSREMQCRRVSSALHGALEQLPVLQLATLREGTWCLCAKGGHNRESHNHNDVGSFSLYEGDVPVLIDVGIGTYTRVTFSSQRYTYIPWVRSAYHCLPVVNGTEQKEGAAYRASSFEAEQGEVSISFAEAYLPEAELKALTRVLTLHETGLSCTDRFSFCGEARRVREVLMTTLSARIEGSTVILGDRYAISTDRGTVSLDYIPFDDALLERDWSAKGATRILFDADACEEITFTVTKL